MITKPVRYPVLLLAMVFLLALASVQANAVFAGTENQPEAPAVAAAGEGALPPAEWRYDGRVRPESPGGYHPYDFDGKKLTLYWEQVLDGKNPVKKYEIYRARANSGVDWSDPAAWGRWPILIISDAENVKMNWKTYAVCSDQRLLVDVEPGREYVYGVRAISGGKTSGISKIPYPFRVPGQSLLGLSHFALIPDLFTEGKYALEMFFSGPVSRSDAVEAANYKVLFDNSPVSLKGPEGGKGVFDPVRNSAALDTGLSTAEPSKLLKITVNNIAGPRGEPMNTSPGGPRNFIAGELNNHVLRESFSIGQGEVVPADPTGGRATEYLFHFKLKEAVPAGGKIAVKFPADYAMGEKISAPDTSTRPRDVNGDINGPYGGRVKISGVQLNHGSNTVFLTLNGKAAAGDHLAFILDGITNPLPPASSGQSYHFSITAPGSSGRAVILPAYVKPAGKGSLTVSLKDGDGSGKPLISGTMAGVTVSGPGLPPGGLSKTGETGTFTFDGIPDNTEYIVGVTSAPAGYKAPQAVLPVWLPKDGSSSLEFILDRINPQSVKTLEVTVNNLPQDLDSRAVVFAAGAGYYKESAVPAEVKDKGATRVYRLNVYSPGEYRVGVYPYTPPSIPGMPDSPPWTMTPPAKIYNITDNTSVNIKLVPRSMLADVKFELKDTEGGIPAGGSIYAFSPASPDTGGAEARIDASGQVTLKLKKGLQYIVGGSAPGMPSFPERRVYVDGGGDVYVDGSTESVSPVPLRFINPGMKIAGYIRYSDGAPAAGLTVTGRSGNSAAGGPLPCVTDAGGKYTLWVMPGNWTVEVNDPGSGARVVTSNADTTGGNVVAGLTLPAPARFSTVTGTVIESGSPVPGVTVWALSANKEVLDSTTTGPDGKYSLRVDSRKTYRSTIHSHVPGVGELPWKAYGSSVDFNVVWSKLTINFGRPVSGQAAVYQPGKQGAGFSAGKEFVNSDTITLRAPNGVYRVDCYIDGIGHVYSDNIKAPGTLNLTKEVKPDNTAPFNLTVNRGGDTAWAVVSDTASGRNTAAGKMTSDDRASFSLPRGVNVGVTVYKEGYFPAVRVFNTDSTNNEVELYPETAGKTITVNLGGRGVSAGNREYLVWARNLETGIVSAVRSQTPTGIKIRLPLNDMHVFRAAAEDYISDEITVSSKVSDTVTLTLNSLVPGREGLQVLHPAMGGVVSNGGLGLKIMVPPYAMGSSLSNVSIKTSLSASYVWETASFITACAARNITALDGSDIIKILNKPVEVVMDYSSEYSTWPAGLKDAIARHLQLAYWDQAVKDWVVIPAANDTAGRSIRGYINHLSQLALVYPRALGLPGAQTAGPGTDLQGVDGLLDGPALDSALESANTTGRVYLQAPSAGTVLTLTAGQTDSMLVRAMPLEIKISGVVFNMYTSALRVEGLRGYISLRADRLSYSGALGLQARSLNSRQYVMMSDVYQIGLKTLRKDGTEEKVERFNAPVRMAIPVPADAMGAAKSGKLLAARFNDSSQRWETVDGEYDQAAGAYRFSTDKTGYWVLVSGR